MAANGVSNVEDTDMAECDGEKVVTMMDVLQEEQDFEDDANAVLGASDEKDCTYAKGYIKRQAIYACLTCCSEAKFDPTKRAGVCLACSLNCHENHDLIELYTKRNFRCDCGNPKFNSHPCQFTPNKSDLNEDNNYNQNFSGLYCTCHRPYPDPEATVEDDEMIQCVICEDWLHASHLEAAVPGVDQYAEMVCKACMEKNDFLHDYSHLVVNNETQDIDVIGINGSETKLTNGDLNVKLINDTEGLIESTEKPDESINAIEKPSDNMEVDDAQIDKTSAENGETTLESKEKDVTMETAAENVNNTSQIPTEPTAESSEETTISEKPLEETTKLETLTEDTTTESGAKLEVKDASTAEASEEPKDISQENIDGPKDIQDSENIDKSHEDAEPGNPEMSAEVHENKDPVEMDESKPEELVTNTESKEDEQTNIDPKEQEEISTNNDNESTDITNATVSEKHVDSEQPKENSETKTDITDNEAISNAEVETMKEESSTLSNDMSNDKAKENVEPSENSEETMGNKTEEIKDNKRKLSTEESSEPDEQTAKKPKINEESNCIRPKGVKRVHKGATFWPSDFRQKLCTCSECLTMYKDLSVLFLVDLEDTVFAYEALGKERVDGRATQYEKGLEALSSLDRIQQINALTEYNKMKDKLLDFLKNFKDRKEVVKEEDIKAFFAGMKPKREPDGVYFCR